MTIEIFIKSSRHVITQAEINNRTKVDPTLDVNFRLSADRRNDNDVLRWYNTSFQRCINTGNQYIFNVGCQHFYNTGYIPGLEVWNRNFFAKVTRLLHENEQKYFIQSNLHCYLQIFPTSPEGDECHANKTVRLLNQTSYPAILVHFRTKWSVV